ncbi:hypothetical protein E2986_13828 [Frieseomelitta varia]|uniref:Uncharacterized protein n=1 Tax=Frieseomelitta varia TaxID=561572 RepID=A0A833SNB1_9HYME|nr:hypothetical protein E2986_13828 [Frieseomelitta varia]
MPNKISGKKNSRVLLTLGEAAIYEGERRSRKANGLRARKRLGIIVPATSSTNLSSSEST